MLCCLKYLQPHSRVVAEEERSSFSTPVTLHPPLRFWPRLCSPALKCAEKSKSCLLPPPKNPDGKHEQHEQFTSSPPQNKAAGSLMPQRKVSIHSHASSPFCFRIESVYGHVCLCTCDENMCPHVFVQKCLQTLSHHASLITEHLHAPVPCAMQETVVAQTNSSLHHWLSVMVEIWPLSNYTLIKV